MVKAKREETAALEGVEDSALLETLPVLAPVLAPVLPTEEITEADVTEVTGKLAVLKKKMVRLSYSLKVNKLTWAAQWWLYQLKV